MLVTHGSNITVSNQVTISNCYPNKHCVFEKKAVFVGIPLSIERKNKSVIYPVCKKFVR